MDSPWIAKNRLLIGLFLSSSEIITGHWLELCSHRAWTQMVHIGNIEQLLQTSRWLLSDKRNFMGRHASYFYHTAEFITTEGLLQQNNWWESLKNESDTVFYRRRGLAFHFKTLYPRNYWTSEGWNEADGVLSDDNISNYKFTQD